MKLILKSLLAFTDLGGSEVEINKNKLPSLEFYFSIYLLSFWEKESLSIQELFELILYIAFVVVIFCLVHFTGFFRYTTQEKKKNLFPSEIGGKQKRNGSLYTNWLGTFPALWATQMILIPNVLLINKTRRMDKQNVITTKAIQKLCSLVWTTLGRVKILFFFL